MPTQIQFRRDTAANWASANPTLAAGELGYDTTSDRFKIGNGNTNWNSLPFFTNSPQDNGVYGVTQTGHSRIRTALSAGNPQGNLRYVSQKYAGSESVTVKSSTGYACAVWWDGTYSLGGTGSASLVITLTKSIPTSGAFAYGCPKTVHVFPSMNASSPNKSGSITYIYLAGSNIQSIDFSGLPLAYLYLSGLSATSLDLSGQSSLTTAILGYAPYVDRLDLYGCNNLTQLTISGMKVAGALDLSQMPSLVGVEISNAINITDINFNPSAPIVNLNVSGCENLASIGEENMTNLESFSATSCHSLTSLNFASNPPLYTLNTWACSNLASILCPGATPGGQVYYHHSYSNVYFGANLAECNLNATALNQFYADLGTGSGYINVESNPGVSGDDPSIATAKGYTVYGT